MGTLSPRRERAACSAHMTGRLMPMAMDNANARLNGLQLSVAMAGLNQSQIDALPITTASLVRWGAERLRHWPFLRRRG